MKKGIKIHVVNNLLMINLKKMLIDFFLRVPYVNLLFGIFFKQSSYPYTYPNSLEFKSLFRYREENNMTKDLLRSNRQHVWPTQ